MKKGKTGRMAGTSARIFGGSLLLLTLILFLAALSNLNEGRQEQAILQLEEAIRRGAAACYAAEGIYPPNLEYLKEHYGIIVDEKRYMVDYQVQGSNLMPDITVLGKD